MAVARKKDAGNAWVSLSTAASALGEARQTVLTRAVKGELEARHVAGRTVISQESLDRCVHGQAPAAERDGALIRRAHAAVTQAIKRGTLVRPDRCGACGRKGRVRAHHDDYNKPLDVKWICDGCHDNRHKATKTGVAGRQRCVRCNGIIYRHMQDRGSVERVEGGLAHKGKCPATRRAR